MKHPHPPIISTIFLVSLSFSLSCVPLALNKERVIQAFLDGQEFVNTEVKNLTEYYVVLAVLLSLSLGGTYFFFRLWLVAQDSIFDLKQEKKAVEDELFKTQAKYQTLLFKDSKKDFLQ